LYQESTNPQLTSSFLLRESTVLAVQSRSDVTLPRINHILLDDLIVKLVNPQLSTPEDNQSDGKQRRFFYGHRLLRWRRRRRLSTLQHLHSGVGAVAPWQFLRGVVKYHVTDRQRGHDEPNQRAQEQIERNEPLPVLHYTDQEQQPDEAEERGHLEVHHDEPHGHVLVRVEVLEEQEHSFDEDVEAERLQKSAVTRRWQC
jgi:hypothetical protein